jgi:cytochrome c oxidase cbb3-type subunit 3
MTSKENQDSQKHQKKESGKAPVHHVFDEIEELDNDLPRWWLNMFYICIVFSVVYLAWYHWPIGKGASPEQEFDAAMKAGEVRMAAEKAKGFDYSSYLQDSAYIANGKAVYSEMCLACHGDRGQGGVGPNLTDDHWIIEPTLAALEGTIADGRLEHGMPAWGPVVGIDKVRQLVVYVYSIRNMNVEGGKEPQGHQGQWP